MEYIFRVDWQALLVPKLSALEMLIRGVVTYVCLCLLLRIVLKRQAGKVALSDLLVVSIVAGICRNPLVADAYSLTDGIGVIAVVLGCSYLFDAASYYSRPFHRLFHPKPVLLVQDGVILHERLREELMTEGQLLCKLRLHGVNDPATVAEAWMEGSGEISVIKKQRPGCAQAVLPSAEAEDERTVEVRTSEWADGGKDGGFTRERA